MLQTETAKATPATTTATPQQIPSAAAAKPIKTDVAAKPAAKAMAKPRPAAQEAPKPTTAADKSAKPPIQRKATKEEPRKPETKSAEKVRT